MLPPHRSKKSPSKAADSASEGRRASAAAASWVVATDHAARAVRTLGARGGRDRHSNGVETEHFRPLNLTAGERLALLRRWLVDDPRGWDESGREGKCALLLGRPVRLTDSTGSARF